MLNVQQSKEDEPEKPVKAVSDQRFEIPKKPKQELEEAPIAVSQVNGKRELDGDSNPTLKRSREDETEPREAKKAKHGASVPADEGVLVVDDDGANGAILIDDD